MRKLQDDIFSCTVKRLGQEQVQLLIKGKSLLIISENHMVKKLRFSDMKSLHFWLS